MFGWLLALVLIIGLIGVIIGLAVCAGYFLRAGLLDRDVIAGFLGAVFLFCAIAGLLFMGAVATGDISLSDSHPDGCYRLTSHWNGKATSQSYETIPCP